jgi:hypothetical protein
MYTDCGRGSRRLLVESLDVHVSVVEAPGGLCGWGDSACDVALSSASL